MALTKQEYLTHDELSQFFQSLYETKTRRQGLSPTSQFSYCTPTDGWQLEGYIDGPLIFIVMIDQNGMNFTGWSKFCNEGQYNETTGIYTAMQKMVEKYCKYQIAANLDDLIDTHWSKGYGDPFALPLTPKEDDDAIQSELYATESDPARKTG